jgi:hypothetical protein
MSAGAIVVFYTGLLVVSLHHVDTPSQPEDYELGQDRPHRNV